MAQSETDSDRDWTTISVKPETRDRLRSLKRGGETYAELLNRLIDHQEECDDA